MSKADLNNLGQLKTKEFITTNMNSFGIEYLQSSGNRVLCSVSLFQSGASSEEAPASFKGCFVDALQFMRDRRT